MVKLPTGTVTLLFADIEGSTRLLQQLGDRFADLLEAYRRILREAFAACGGYGVDAEGDGFFAAFGRASDAVRGAVSAQRAVGRHAWPEGVNVRVRMALHTGEPSVVDDQYVGVDVHRAARICAAGHGGQILLSQTTRELLGDQPSREAAGDGVTLRDMGVHELKDLGAARLFQVIAPDLPADFPPLRSANALHDVLTQVRRFLTRKERRQGAAPPGPTPIIGRSQEVAAARGLLTGQGVRLLTLTGPPGIGKTRLALEVAAGLESGFEAIIIVDLAPITDPELVFYALASALGLRESGARVLADRLAEHLGGRAVLLVLDNFEQVIEAAPQIGGLLEATSELKILVTSRERLRLAWEQEFPVPPLAMPDRARAARPELMAKVPAVELFLERARAVHPDFNLTAENGAAVAEICLRLGGLPLAIELCAPRVKVLSPQEILQRLQRQLDLLTTGPRDLPPRQRTLRAAIAWSEELLSVKERAFLRRLGVFVGGWSLEAAFAVCDGDAGFDILEGIASLMDKSLIRRTSQVEAGVRFGMLDAIREYAIEQLEGAGEIEQVRERHARCFASIASGVERAVLTPKEEASIWGLVPDRDNLLTSIEWAMDHGDAETAFAAAAGLAWTLYIRGQLSEGSAWVDRVLAGPPASDTLKMALLVPAGALALGRGHLDLAAQRLDEALHLSSAARDVRAEAMARAFLGNVARARGSHDRAEELHRMSLGLYKQSNNRRGVAWTLYDLALDARARGDDPEARGLLEQALQLFEEQDYRWATAWATWHVGHLALSSGDPRGAAEHFAKSLALYRGIEDNRGVAQAVEALAAVSAASQDPGRAARLYSGADALRITLGALRDASEQTAHEAQVRSLRGALGERRFGTLWDEGRRLDVAALVDLAQAAAGIPQTPEPSREAMPLTRREQQVAALIARGLSNREIAEALGVTERTAVSHIEHIMNKLSVNTRSQIAVWAVRHGLEPAEV